MAKLSLPPLTDRDRRTVRVAGIGLAAYLLLFGGWQLVRKVGETRAEYQQMQREAVGLKVKYDLYDARVTRLKRLMETFQMDPARLPKTTLLADAGAALQQSAMQGGLQLGPIRETLTHGADRELGTIQLEAAGQVQALMSFLHRLKGLGYPLVIDTLQFSSDPRRPGMLKINLGLILLNYEQWQEKEGSNA